MQQQISSGCDEGIADSVDGLLDTAGAPVELVQDGLQWIQPMDFYIHVSRLHFILDVDCSCKITF